MEYKSRCIVLRTVKYGDNKLIVDLLSREEGRISLVCAVAMKGKSSGRGKVHRQLLQPLTILDIDYERTPRQSMGKLLEARIAVVYTTLPFDGVKLSLSFFIAEFLCLATRDLHADALLYDFAEQSLVWMDFSSRGLVNFHLMFIVRLTKFLGFYPDMDSYEPGLLFDLREGTFVRYVPLHRDYLAADDAQRMVQLLRMSPSNLHLFKISRAERNRAVDICLAFYRLHIPGFGEMKTLGVLREN